MSCNRISTKLIGLAVLFGTAVGMGQPTEFNFRSIDVPGAALTRPLGINPEGDIVGNYTMAGVVHSYVLSKGVVTTVDPPYGISGTSTAQGINPRGDIVGNYT